MRRQRTILLVFILGMGLTGFLFYKTKERPLNVNVPRWNSDSLVLQKQLSFLGTIKRCAWRSGVAEDRSRGVPGPSSVFLRGNAILEDKAFEHLQAQYDWTPAKNGNADAFEPAPDDAKFSEPLLESVQLIQRLHVVSTYQFGTIYLLPSEKTVFFDVVKD